MKFSHGHPVKVKVHNCFIAFRLFLAGILGEEVNRFAFNSNFENKQLPMKAMKLLLAVLFLFSVSGHTFAQENAAASPAKNDSVKTVNPNAAEITFENDVHDYGTIKQNADGGCEFKFKNTGKEPLIITNAKGSCGCTVPTYPKEPIMKGETGVIKVHYDTKRVGAFTKTVTINSNAKTDTKVLTIKGVVEASEETTDQVLPLKKSTGSPLENSK